MSKCITVKGGEFVEGSWKDFRDDVYAVEPELAKIIDQIDPSDEYKLIKGAYLYGEPITQLGKVCVPNTNGALSPLDADDVPKKFKQQLGYCPTPLTLQLSRASEVYLDADNRVMPLNIFNPGDFFGLFEVLVPYTNCGIKPTWSVAAGVKSVFLAPAVNNASGNRRLEKEYRIKKEYNGDLINQWRIFKSIAHHTEEGRQWKCEVLFFTSDWVNPSNDSREWLFFQNFLFAKAWWQSKNIRIRSNYAFLWEIFASAVGRRNYKPTSHCINTIMHCLFIANGNVPGFRPLKDTSEMLLPSNIIETAYVEVYSMLGNYPPIIIVPTKFGIDNDYTPIYYSYNYPTLLEGAYYVSIREGSAMGTIRRLIPLMEMLQDVLIKEDLEFYEHSKQVEYKYYHTKRDKYNEILPAETIIDTDPNVAVCMKRFPGKVFPTVGPFFRGMCGISVCE